MSIQVLKPGVLDTVQDLGRQGFSQWGINPGGVMDFYAASIANTLVGNDEHQAVIELHFPSPQWLFEQSALISICGADFAPTLNGTVVPLWQPLLIRKNTVLYFDRPLWGMRCYIAIHGGWAIPSWLGSWSTNLKAGAGGFKGRKLEKGDRIAFREAGLNLEAKLKTGEDYTRLHWKAQPRELYLEEPAIDIVKGHEWELLSAASRTILINESFQLEPSADRMGFPLKGPSLATSVTTEMISSGVAAGTLQLLPSGKLIILMADHQTTGGYPKIGHVITAHLPRLAQRKPGNPFRFRMVSQETAIAQLFMQKQELAVVSSTCQENIRQWLL